MALCANGSLRPSEWETDPSRGALPDWRGDVPELLRLAPSAPDSFRSRLNQPNFHEALYGGQLLAQAVVAAGATVAIGALHSLHAYFLNAAIASVPVDYAVERVRDSRNSASRRVIASQRGRTVFELSCLFRNAQPGQFHQIAAPLDVAPETLESLVDIHNDDPSILGDFGRFLLESAPVEIRPLSRDDLFFRPGPARRQFWVRVPTASSVDDPGLHRAMLAYLSDYWFARVSLIPYRSPVPTHDLFFASVDHSMWFHADARADDWLLYDAESPIVTNGTGLAQGRIFDRQGKLVATTTQDAIQMMRRDSSGSR